MADPTTWVLSEVEGQVNADGSIQARTLWSQPMTTPRPRGEAIQHEIQPDLDVIRRVNQRIPGSFKTRVRWGRGIAWCLNTRSLDWMSVELQEKLAGKYGRWGNLAFCGPWRDAEAPGTCCCADTCNDVATDVDPQLVCVMAGLEIAIYKDDGWVGYQLPTSLVEYQERLNERQASWWRLVRPGFPQGYWAMVNFQNIGRDTLDDSKVNLSGESQSGSFEDVRVAHLSLPGEGFKIRDIEHARKVKCGDEWFEPLNRKLVLIMRRVGSGPIMFELDPAAGCFTAHSRVTVLDGSARTHDINKKVQSLLTDALCWF